MRTVTLRGLHGVSGVDVDAVMFERAESAQRLLKHNRAITAAGYMGAISIWRDDDGKYRCERMYFMATKAFATVDTPDQVTEWLRTNLPLIGKEAA